MLITSNYITSGLSDSKEGKHVLVLGATNLPWGLDSAFIRRFQKRVYIPLPDEIARIAMFKLNMAGMSDLTDDNFRTLGMGTEG